MACVQATTVGGVSARSHVLESQSRETTRHVAAARQCQASSMALSSTFVVPFPVSRNAVRRTREPSFGALIQCNGVAFQNRPQCHLNRIDDPSMELAFAVGANVTPHPDKVAKGGEDAYFVHNFGGGVLGIADGVGGWAEQNVDPALYSKELMAHAEAAVSSEEMEYNAQMVLAKAHAATSSIGAATAILALLERNGTMHVASVGDCGLRIIRQDLASESCSLPKKLITHVTKKVPVAAGRVLFATKPQQHYFDCPYQFSSESSGQSAADAVVLQAELNEGDCIVMGSDGLFDNVFDRDIETTLSIFGGFDQESAERCANALAALASRNSRDPTFESPYSKEAIQQGFDVPWHKKILGKKLTGGKMDDITVIVAHVVKGQSPPAEEIAENAKEMAATTPDMSFDSGQSGGGVEPDHSSTSALDSLRATVDVGAHHYPSVASQFSSSRRLLTNLGTRLSLSGARSQTSSAIAEGTEERSKWRSFFKPSKDEVRGEGAEGYLELAQERLVFTRADVSKAAVMAGLLGLQLCLPAFAEQANLAEVAPISDLNDFQNGFSSAFLLIFFSEIGDKTFFIAALLATRKSNLAVFVGTFGALAAMTVISVTLGRAFHYLDDLIPATQLPLDDLAAVVLLVYFGVSTLVDAASMKTSKAEEEKQDAELAIAGIGPNGNLGFQAAASTVAATFALVFVAEWGDKSFFSTIALAAASSPAGVVTGAIAGHGAATVLAVLGGSFLSEYISEKLIAYVGGVLFLVFAASTLVGILNK